MDFHASMVEELVVETANSSTCEKSKRGVVLHNGTDRLFAACNEPPSPFKCERNSWCRTNCSKVAVHAEERAIILAGCDLFGWEMVHGKSVDGNLVVSGPPSCWQCSRMIVEAGIAGMWLYHEDGWKRYTAEEFHRLTLDHCFPKD